MTVSKEMARSTLPLKKKPRFPPEREAISSPVSISGGEFPE